LVQEHTAQEITAVRALVEHSGLSCYASQVHETGLDKVDAVIVAVSDDYNPLFHAREVAAQGDPFLGLDVFSLLPHDVFFSDTDIRSTVAVEKQRYWLAWQKGPGAATQVSGAFFRAQMEFYTSIYFPPPWFPGTVFRPSFGRCLVTRRWPQGCSARFSG